MRDILLILPLKPAKDFAIFQPKSPISAADAALRRASHMEWPCRASLSGASLAYQL